MWSTYALVDYCMGSTLWAQTTREERIATISIAINYIQTATEGEVICRTTLDRRNRTNAVMHSEVRHEDGRLLVTAIGSYTIFAARGLARAPLRAGARRGDQASTLTAKLTPTALDDRRLGLRRRRRHPGRPEGVRALRRARDVRDHGDHRAEHARRQRDPRRCRPEIVLAQVRAVLADIGVDAVKVGMLGSAAVTLAVAAALDELPGGHARGGGPGDGRRVRRAAARARRRALRW